MSHPVELCKSTDRVNKTFSCEPLELPYERNHCVTRKELLAVVKTLEYFHKYLYSQRFHLRTDLAFMKWLFTETGRATGKMVRATTRVRFLPRARAAQKTMHSDCKHSFTAVKRAALGSVCAFDSKRKEVDQRKNCERRISRMKTSNRC